MIELNVPFIPTAEQDVELPAVRGSLPCRWKDDGPGEGVIMKRGKSILLAVIGVLVVLFFAFDLGRFLTLESLKANRTTLEQYAASHRLVTVGLFIALYIVQTALALPGAAVLTVAGGALFGAVAGTIYVNLGATAGASLAFLLARHLFRDEVQKRFGQRIETVNRELDRSGIHYLLFLRLVPVFPFFLINVAAGLTSLPLRSFLFGTMIGIIPGSFVYCYAGASLATVTSLNDIVSPRVLGALALLGLFAMVPVVYEKIRRYRGRDSASR